SAELPARRRRKEIAVAGAQMRGRRGARSASKNILVHHELAVVFSDGARSCAEARIRCIRARSPLPDIAEATRPSGAGMQPPALQKITLERLALRRNLPFRLGRQPRPGPARIGIGFEVADVRDSLRR